MPRKEYLNVRVTMATYKAVVKASEEADRKMADYLRIVIEQHLREKGYLQ